MKSFCKKTIEFCISGPRKRVIWLALSVLFLWASDLQAQDFEHITPGSLKVYPASGAPGCDLTVNFDVTGYKDNEPFMYSVGFAATIFNCVPQVGGTVGNNFVVDGS